MVSHMPSPKKPRARKRPEADATCSLVRTVMNEAVRLDLWTCSAPAPASEPASVSLVEVAPRTVFKKIGRRKWRFFYVTAQEAHSENARAVEAGWYFDAANPSPFWLNNEPNGPYATLREAREDARCAVSAMEDE